MIPPRSASMAITMGPCPLISPMASYGIAPDAFIYVADAALVTPDNLAKADEQEIESWPAEKLLSLYKDQNGIEKNFGFLKDPVIVNSIFLKKPHRIEVLGLILLISLLIWRLMERSMRRYVKTFGSMTGWENRPTKRPTSFMMTTKFIHILVIKSAKQRKLAKPLKPVQLEYLKALNVDPNVFTFRNVNRKLTPSDSLILTPLSFK